MPDNLFEIDSAMNMIKEDIIKELYESVTREKQETCLTNVHISDLSFPEKLKD